ncbi:MAG: type II toxin-antitoxin system RelE/ParE family toxin [Candidatus Cloacimonetes bacterium]|nr:type II toxin-antitoxin system RelE/ParE family toxin [Candidatus Cloacimonadota bacterium]
MYKLEITPSAHKFIKKLPKNIRQKIYEESYKILINPYVSEKLHGELRDCRSHNFRFRGVWYRVAYVVDEEKKKIVVVFAGTREGFYKRLQHLIR